MLFARLEPLNSSPKCVDTPVIEKLKAMRPDAFALMMSTVTYIFTHMFTLW